MNREETIEAIKVMQAWVDGKKVQVFVRGNWYDVIDSDWDWSDHAYRIKPEPREWLVRVDEKNRIYDETTCAAPFERIKVREVLE